VYFELPTEFVKNTFVGFVLPSENNTKGISFFETLVDELQKEKERVEKPVNRHIAKC
jgi:hypothetical protein